MTSFEQQSTGEWVVAGRYVPCAYTEFATCPLPPAENRLPIAVEAGEQIPLPA
ncbi:DUF1684 domain-containing protein [Actinoplanes sp. ATCC 53533]|uniref:DUF1684 domain-containing protein n=1 Tax=Actinoplanes sp. ATCC 53533 TaxID=1288362 RepID=UPI001F43CA45|nr:DUF1684 domain-containing protein [Actinoplanes sp. ATCC 53533]